MLSRAIKGLVVGGLLAVGTAAWAGDANLQAKVTLGRNVPQINFTGVPLKDALDFLRDVTGVNIHVDWKTLDAAGIAQDAPINVKLRDVPMRKVLSLVLTEAAGDASKLSYFIQSGVIEITTKEVSDAQMLTIVYPIQDLIFDASSIQQAGGGGMMGGGMMGGGMMGGGMMGGGMGGYGGGMGGGMMGGGYGGGMMGGGYGGGGMMGGGYGGGGMMGGGYGGGYGGGVGGGYGGGYGGYAAQAVTAPPQAIKPLGGRGGGGGGGGGGRGGGGGGRGGGGGGRGGGGGGGGRGGGGGGGGGGNGGLDPDKAEDLIIIITQTISPDVWAKIWDDEQNKWVAGTGKATIVYFDGNLVITAPRDVHEAIGGSID